MMGIEITINTILYFVLTIIIGLTIHLLVTPSNKKKTTEEIKASTLAFDDLVKNSEGGWGDDHDDDDEDNTQAKGGIGMNIPTKTAATGATASGGATATATTATSNKVGGVSPAGTATAVPPPAPAAVVVPKLLEEEIVTTDKHGNPLPYQIGDRVIIQKLSGQKELNGRHGTITHPGYDSGTQRYPVDLDLIDINRKKKPTLSVKADNLKRESTVSTLQIPDCTIFDDDNEDNEEEKEENEKKKKDDDDNKEDNKNNKSTSITTSDGCLISHHAKAASFIWDVYRKSIVGAIRGQAPPGTPPPNDMCKIANFGWLNWKPPPHQGQKRNNPNQNKANGFYDGLTQFLCKGILGQQKLSDLDKHVSPNSTPILGAYKLVTSAMTSQYAVGSWNVRIEGDFWLINNDNDNSSKKNGNGNGIGGTYCSYVHNPKQIFLVQGYLHSLFTTITKNGTIHYPRPPKFYLCLVPWYGTLIYDPFLIKPTTGTNQIELASTFLTNELLSYVQLAKKQNRIISSLKQLEVENGSLQGLQYQPPQITPLVPTHIQQSQAGGQQAQLQKPPQQEPATEEERILVDNLTDFPNVLKPPMGMWSIIQERSLIGPTANDNSMVILSGNGQKLGQFTLRHVNKPTVVDYLQGVLNHCSSNSSGQSSDRPSMIGVDNLEICQRLQFLIHGKVPKCQIVMLQIKKKPPTTTTGGGGGGGGPSPVGGGPTTTTSGGGGGGGTSFAESPPFPLPP